MVQPMYFYLPNITDIMAYDHRHSSMHCNELRLFLLHSLASSGSCNWQSLRSIHLPLVRCNSKDISLFKLLNSFFRRSFSVLSSSMESLAVDGIRMLLPSTWKPFKLLNYWRYFRKGCDDMSQFGGKHGLQDTINQKTVIFIATVTGRQMSRSLNWLCVQSDIGFCRCGNESLGSISVKYLLTARITTDLYNRCTYWGSLFKRSGSHRYFHCFLTRWSPSWCWQGALVGPLPTFRIIQNRRELPWLQYSTSLAIYFQ
jgi:hypothetical protein